MNFKHAYIIASSWCKGCHTETSCDTIRRLVELGMYTLGVRMPRKGVDTKLGQPPIGVIETCIEILSVNSIVIAPANIGKEITAM
jgi:hypothetical protein